MVRQSVFALLTAALLSGVLACSEQGGAAPSTASPMAAASRAPSTATLAPPAPAASPSASPASVAAEATPAQMKAEGRLPSVIAEVSLAPAGGDAYGIRDVAYDEEGRAIVLCERAGTTANAALVTVDPHLGTRGPVVPLPFSAPTLIAAGAGRVYVFYLLDGNKLPGLAAVEPDTGRVLAAVGEAAEGGPRQLLADSAGHLYLSFDDRLEVRDGATLAVVRSLPWPSEAMAADPYRGQVSVAIDPAGGRLFLATAERLLAYRTGDLRLLWEVSHRVPPLRDAGLVIDAAGDRVYLWSWSSDGQVDESLVLPYEVASGHALEPLLLSTDADGGGLRAPGSGAWRLRAADSRQGYLLFSGTGSRGGALLWKTGLDGRPAFESPAPVPHSDLLSVHEGRLLLSPYGSHQVVLYDLGDLQPERSVLLGVEIVDLVADPDDERLYVNDASGQLHVLAGADYRPIAALPAGRGPLVLDEANGLLFVAREPYGTEVAVVDTNALTVTAVITGGSRVAVDPAGGRAFVGMPRTAMAPNEVQVWDTRTFRRLGAIPGAVDPVYNPLRGEVYVLRERTDPPAIGIVDGETLAPAGTLGLDPGRAISVDIRQELIVNDLGPTALGGADPDARFLSARTLEPLTHPATVVRQPDGSALVLVPAEDGRVYVGPRGINPRGPSICGRVSIVRAGTGDVLGELQDLCLDLYLPGTGVGLMRGDGDWQAFDLGTGELIASWPDPGLRRLDVTAGRLFAWEGSTLSVLDLGG